MKEELWLPLTEQNNLIPAIFRPGLTTNSYKYFWFLGLLDTVREWDEMDIPLLEIGYRMILRAWYPVAFFRLNFGKVDELQTAILLIQQESGLPNHASNLEILEVLRRSAPDSAIGKVLTALLRYVPYRLLTPWFEEEIRGEKDARKNDIISVLSDKRSVDPKRAPLYYFKEKSKIRLTWNWRGYLIDHNAILLDFVFWRLAEFLEKRNPNTPNISAKLVPIQENRGHSRFRAAFHAFVNEVPNIECIYSGQILSDFELDHFVPWSFTAHDLPWNLVPVSRDANNQKRDSLPDKSYLPRIADFQLPFLRFLESHERLKARKEIIDSFEFLTKQELGVILNWDRQTFQKEISECFIPMLLQAKHQGFPGPWTFTQR